MPQLKLSDLPAGLYLGGQSYNSVLPPESELDLAFKNPLANRLLSEDGLAEKLQTDATTLVRSTLGRAATQIGAPMQLMGSMVGAIEAVVTQDVRQLAMSAAKAALDVYLEAMGAIPFVGPIARIGVTITEAIYARSQQKLPPPPLITYRKPVNDFYATELAAALGKAERVAVDWTPIFRPPGVGPWEVIPYEPEQQWIWQPAGVSVRDDGAVVDGWGIVPGTFGASLQVWTKRLDLSYFVAAIDGKGLSNVYALAHDFTYDYSALLPSFSRAGASAWEATTTRTAAMYNVDVRGLGTEWKKYVEYGLALRDKTLREGWNKKDGYVHPHAIAAYFMPFALYDLPTAEAKLAAKGGKPSWPMPSPDDSTPHKGLPYGRRIDSIARVRLAELRGRQEKGLLTLLCAYCSEKQAAFSDPALASRLAQSRKMLLKDAGALASVELDSIIDDDYRAAVANAKMKAGGGFQLTAAPGTGGHKLGPLDAIPPASGWEGAGAPRGGSGLRQIGRLAFVAGLGWIGYEVWKATLRKR